MKCFTWKWNLWKRWPHFRFTCVFEGCWKWWIPTLITCFGHFKYVPFGLLSWNFQNGMNRLQAFWKHKSFSLRQILFLYFMVAVIIYVSLFAQYTVWIQLDKIVLLHIQLQNYPLNCKYRRKSLIAMTKSTLSNTSGIRHFATLRLDLVVFNMCTWRHGFSGHVMVLTLVIGWYQVKAFILKSRETSLDILVPSLPIRRDIVAHTFRVYQNIHGF